MFRHILLLVAIFLPVSPVHSVQLAFEGTIGSTAMNFSIYGPQTAFPTTGYNNQEWAIGDTSNWSLYSTQFPAAFSRDNNYGQQFFCAPSDCRGIGEFRYHELVDGYDSGTGLMFSHEIDIHNLLGPLPVDNLLNIANAFSYDENSIGVSTNLARSMGFLTLVAIDYSVGTPRRLPISPIPEPGILALIALGLAGLGFVRGKTEFSSLEGSC